MSAPEVIEEIHYQGGLAIACHPYYKISELDDPRKVGKTTIYLWKNRNIYRQLIDAWEIGNQKDLFSMIGLEGLPFIANSDFHDFQDIYSWKTVVFAQKKPEDVLKAIKEQNIGITFYRNPYDIGQKTHLSIGREYILETMVSDLVA